MELVNQTPVVAEVMVAAPRPDGRRLGHLIAKATFRIEEGGTVRLETDEPTPLFALDQSTDLGLLPADLIPRSDPVFEVILLGAAHAPGGREVTHQTVELAIGGVSRRLLVSGDRRWVRHEGRSYASDPVPYSWMPLTWDRAFGGQAEVWLDGASVVPLRHPLNPYGRGLDAERMAASLGEAVGAAEGYPRIRYERMLPNVEDPERAIRTPDDVPPPACWATVPPDAAVRAEELAARVARGEKLDPQELFDRGLHRAHPSWVIQLPPAGSIVTLRGVTDDGELRFRLPPLRILADYVLAGRTGTRELVPHLLVLLAEERRLYLVYRAAFAFEAGPRDERSFRLRLETGWYSEGRAP